MDEDIIILPTTRIKKGLVIAQDILSNSGDLLVAKHTEFSTEVKTRLMAFGITKVPIFNDGLLQTPQFQPVAPEKLKIDFTDVKSSIPVETIHNVLSSKTSNITTIDKENVTKPVDKPNPQFFTDSLPRNIAIKEDPKFKFYSSLYKTSLEQYKVDLKNMILKNRSLNIPKILSIPLQLVNLHNTDFSVLEMLHNIKIKKDPIFCHSYNTALICGVIANLLDLSFSDTQILLISALLHDIGKLLIPVNILNKPDTLTEDEYNIITTHPVLGYNIIKNQDLDPRIKACVLMHHEKCDGSGYPAKLSSERLPEFVKILAIADTYDAMSSKRIYRDAFCPFEIIKKFEDQGFSKYEPSILIPFLHHIADTYINSKVLLNDGRIGTIVMINENILSKPLLFVKDQYIDLSKDYNLSIIEIV